MEEFVSGYIECALWLGFDYSIPESNDNSIDLRDHGGEDAIHPDTLREMKEDCADFLGGLENTQLDIISEDWAQAGHDFYLTRNGHGAGFWDGHWGEWGDALSEASEPYGTFQLYLEADGLIYHHN